MSATVEELIERLRRGDSPEAILRSQLTPACTSGEAGSTPGPWIAYVAAKSWLASSWRLDSALATVPAHTASV